MNPLNQLPVDPALYRRVDELVETCAKETGAMVLVLVMKENDKLHVCMDGVPETGLLADVAKDVPRLLESIADMLRLTALIEAREPRS